jgi:hypothetical protein
MLDNIFKYCPDSAAILHVSNDFSKEFYGSLNKERRNVFINPINLYTGFSDQTLFFVHYSNILYLNENKINFGFFTMFASNQLFVRYGLENHLSDCIGSKYQPKNKFDVHQYRFEKDNKTRMFLLGSDIEVRKIPPEGTFYESKQIHHLLMNKNLEKFYESNLYFFSTATGAFIRRKLTRLGKRFVSKKISFISRYIPSVIKRFTYASEEIIFPSLMVNQDVAKESNLFCFLNWEKNLDVQEIDIDKIRLGQMLGVYSVKRVDRVYDDPIRKLIRCLDNE